MASFMQVTPPAEEPVGLEALRAFLRVSHEAEDALIGHLGRAARARVEEETGRALMPQTWRMAADVEEGKARGGFLAFELRRPPYLSFIEARVAKADGTSVALTLDAVRVDADGNTVWLNVSGAMVGARAWRPVEVVWRCGAADADGVPEPLKEAILLMTAHAYERRDAAGKPLAAEPESIAALIAPYRVLRL